MPKKRTYVALVTFERMDDRTDYLPPDMQGACGYMAISALDEDGVRSALHAELRDVGLRLLSVEEIEETDIESFPSGFDDH